MTTHIKGKVHFPRGIFRRFLHETALQDEAQSLLYGFFFSDGNDIEFVEFEFLLIVK